MIFIGYYNNSKAYRLYNSSIKKIIKSRDVYFNVQEEIEENTSESVGEVRIFEEEDDIPTEEIIRKEAEQDIEEKMDVSTPIKQFLRRSDRVKQPPRQYWITQQEEQANITYLEEPPSYQAAKDDDNAKEWMKVMKLELEAINRNKTWTLTMLSPDRKIISSK